MTESSSKPIDIAPIGIEEEMKRSYLDYAMSVIVSRALPDVRDGLKPVHRRILYAMEEGNYDPNRPYRKSARLVGDVMGKYHPHGDSAIYDALVRMAQDFSMRLPLVDGQGNFGSMDGDPPAAMRYTEVRMASAAKTLLEDIDKNTVDFQENYDNTDQEPSVLPARFPNLLVNGAGGIAVGMATNIPPHNLGEVIDACLALIENPDLTITELVEILPGPDFPTGGIIMGRAGILAAYHIGRGSIMMRGRTVREERSRDREAIIVTEIPYQVNKSRMVEQIADAVRDKRVEGISDLRDESDRDGVRVVIELKRDATYDVVLNQLYRFSSLQMTFGVNALALNHGRPEQLNIKAILEAFLAFREEVITRRTAFELAEARKRAHILVGLAVAVANIDEVIALIRKAPDPQTAREQMLVRAWPAETVAPLIKLINDPEGKLEEDDTYHMTEAQARAILDLRLHRLTALERDKLGDDLKALVAKIIDYLEILGKRERRLEILRAELTDVRERFATPRRTDIQDVEFEADIEDLIEREDMVVTVTGNGYVKRVPLSTYRAQRRGGKGRAGMATREEDFVSQVFIVNTHTPVLFFTTGGMAYCLKAYKLPLGTPQARGKPLVNLLPLEDGESLATMMPLPEDEDSWGDLHVMFATSSGDVRRNSLSDFTNIKANGKIAMRLEDDSGRSFGRLIGVQTCSEDHDILLAARGGKCIRFPVTDVRVFSSRYSTGVRGIRLARGDEVVSMSVLNHVEIDLDERDTYLRAATARRRLESGDEIEGEDAGSTEFADSERYAKLEAQEEVILTVTENGFGKRTSAYEYRVAGRGGQGVINIETSDRNGPVVASFSVNRDDQAMLVTDAGQLIRIPVGDIRIAGRNTQGVTLFRTAKDEHVVSVTRLSESNGDRLDDETATDDGGKGEESE